MLSFKQFTTLEEEFNNTEFESQIQEEIDEALDPLSVAAGVAGTYIYKKAKNMYKKHKAHADIKKHHQVALARAKAHYPGTLNYFKRRRAIQVVNDRYKRMHHQVNLRY